MDQTQCLVCEDDGEETPLERHTPVGNLHMFAGIYGPAQDFPIYPGPNVIGRQPTCDITLPAQSVSKKHAILDVTGDCHTICDSGSLNKTRRRKVALAPDVRYALSEGDFLLFADVACRYTIVKKIEVEDSEDDSVLVPGTQAILAIENTPGAAIRRIGRGTVLAKDSGDEDEDDTRRGWNDGGEGGSKDAPRTKGPSVTFSPAADTVVPESDGENDTSVSETPIPSLHLRRESETDIPETPARGNSFIPSSLNIFTPPAVKEPSKDESNRILTINREEKPVGGQTVEEIKTKSAEKDVTPDGEHSEGRKEDGADARLPCEGGSVVQSETVDSGVKDGESITINRSSACENSLKNDAPNIEPPEASSISTSCINNSEDESLRSIITPTSVTESNPNSPIKAEEDNLKPMEEDVKEADLCLDSDTDVDEEAPNVFQTDVKKKDDLQSESDKKSEQNNVEGLETSDSGCRTDSDANVDDKEKTSATLDRPVGEINIDSDTDVEDNAEVSKTGNAETKTSDENSNEAPKIDTTSTDLNIDSDTDVEDEDISRTDEKKAAQESGTFVDEKKEEFHMNSDTDVEDDGDVSSTKVRKGDDDSMASDVPRKETEGGIHLDSDTDVEEDAKTSNTNVAEGNQALNVDVQEDFHVESDTDVEDDVPKEKEDFNKNVQDARCLPLDSDTDVEEEDQRPGPSSAVPSKATGSHIDNQHVEAVKNENDTACVKNTEAADQHYDSETDVDEDGGTSVDPEPDKASGPVMIQAIAEKNEAAAVNQTAALHMDSDTDVDEDDTGLQLAKSQTDKGEIHSVASEGGDGKLDKILGSSDSEMGGADEVPGPETSTVPVESIVEETQKVDVQGADYEIMATQCYLEPKELETDLPDEEEATQAYILSSTLVEPDLFKRPSDPVGVLQISAVTLDKSEEEEEDDENAVAETQLFCFDANQSPGPDIKETSQLDDESVDNQQETQPASSVEESNKEAPESPQEVISQDDTEPVSQYLSTAPPVEKGTWLHLRRDVPTSAWIKGLQQEEEISDVKEDTTDEDSTQVELDLPPLELEATQSYILESSNVQEHPIQDHTPFMLSDQEDHSKLESTVPATDNPSTGPSMLETDASSLPSAKSTLTGPSIPEMDVSVAPSTESTPPASCIPDTLPVSQVPLTGNLSTEPSNLELDVSAVPAIESQSKELINMETQVTDDDDASQAYSHNLPMSAVNVPQNDLGVTSPKDATAPCGSNVVDTAEDEAQSSSITILALEEERTKLTDTGKGKPLRRGLSRNRKKEQSEKSTESSNEKVQVPEQAAPPAHSAPEETAELPASESEQSEIEPEKVIGRRGGRRKAAEETEGKILTKDELVVSTNSRKRTYRMASQGEPSTSATNDVNRRKPSRKSAVKVKEEEPKPEDDLGSSSEKCKDTDISEALPENLPEKKDGLRSRDENVVGSTLPMNVGEMDVKQEKDPISTSLEPSGSGDKIVSISIKNTENEESRILDLTGQSEIVSAPQNKQGVRGKRRSATKAKLEHAQETESNNVEGEASGALSEKQDDFKMPTSRTLDSQDGGQEGPRGKRTRKSQVSIKESLEEEKPKSLDTKVSQNERANKTWPEDQTSGNTRSIRQRRNVKEDSQREEPTVRVPSKRSLSLRGNERNKDKNSQPTLEDLPDSSVLSKRTRKLSKEETPEQETDVEKTEEDNTVQLPRRTRKSYREDKKTEDSEGSPEGSGAAKAQTTKRTRIGSKGLDMVDQKETVKETVTRTRRSSKAEDTQIADDQSKKPARTRRMSKEAEVQESTTETKKNGTAGQNTSSRSRRNVKADEKTASEHDMEISQSVRSSSRTRRKATTQDIGKPVKEEQSEGSKVNVDEPSTREETPRKGRTRKASCKEELPQVSTPVASRKRGQASKTDMELQRKTSDETQEAKEIPTGRRGRPRKLTATSDSQTSAGGREISTPEPSPTRSSRQRQSPVSSNLAEVRTPRRTCRLSASTLTSSPYIPQTGAPPKVLFTGVVDATGEEIIRSLGGDIADSVFDCTHLVTDRVRRTVKFLCALARGIPIVTLDWIDKCKKSGCFLSHTKFLVKDKEQEKNFNFVLSESLQKAKKRLLLEGYEIHVTPSVKPDSDLMKDIISCSGATFLPKMPRTFKEKCVIVSCSEDASRCKSVPSRTPITTAEFILSGILRQEVNPGAYLLSNAEEESPPVPAKRRR